ncbi:septation protein SepH, partial [Angustibacter aerolatus]
MPDLRLVAVHDDGEHLVLEDAAGERYLLPVDEPLRAAVRRDRAHLGQLQIEMDGGMRPRDVQSRIRAGASADEVARVTGWQVERVRRFEGPVQAEREHGAGLARNIRLRRRSGPGVTLGAEVASRLAARGVDADAVTWDSWRVDDGPWTVVVSFSAGGRDRQARWHLDLVGRSATPADDEARWLSEEVPSSDAPVGGRLTAVPGPDVYDIEADGGVDTPRSSGQLSGHDVAALDLVGAMRSRRRDREGRRTPGPADVPGA